MSGPNLWWIYDTDEKSFSTLPTGPFLVPALFICALSALWRSRSNQQHTTESIAGELVNTAHWQAKRKRQLELVQRLVDTNNNLEIHERHELQQLKKYLNNPHGY
jgi:hypothetical protein